MNLSRPDRAARLDALAAEYVLGTLSARARGRLARAAQSEPAVAAAIAQWEDRLVPLAEGVQPVNPPPRVWRELVQRLGLADSAAATPASAGWSNQLAFWRRLALAGMTAALGLLVLTLIPRADLPAPAPALVAVLAGTDAKPALIATASRGDRYLLVKTVGAASVAADRSLELWMLPEGGAPRSMGVLPPGGIARVALRAEVETALAGIPALAISLEPAGGSTTGAPTGPVLYSGKIERML